MSYYLIAFAIGLECIGIIKISNALVSHLNAFSVLKELCLSLFSSKRAKVNLTFSSLNAENKVAGMQGVALVLVANFLQIIIAVYLGLCG